MKKRHFLVLNRKVLFFQELGLCLKCVFDAGIYKKTIEFFRNCFLISYFLFINYNPMSKFLNPSPPNPGRREKKLTGIFIFAFETLETHFHSWKWRKLLSPEIECTICLTRCRLFPSRAIRKVVLKSKITWIIIFALLCGASKGFMKAFIGFMKSFAAPQ